MSCHFHSHGAVFSANCNECGHVYESTVSQRRAETTLKKHHYACACGISHCFMGGDSVYTLSLLKIDIAHAQ